MNANDELRAELTKRGIEWRWQDERTTYWYVTVDGEEWGEWRATEMGGYLFLDFSSGEILTPAQAIAATLGTGTLTAEQVSRATYAHSIHADCADADWQAIADELNAMSGAGTCHNVHEPPKDTTFWPSPHFKCSECGATHVSMEYVYFCPNCGRKVVGE